MGAAPPRLNEAETLAALRNLQVLDTAAEPVFDAIVKAASLVVGAPISLVSLVDENRQWFKASIGLGGITETPRDIAFCAHAVLQDDLFEIPDATKDPRFADNPFVSGDGTIRYYAGVPLKLRDGEHIGTLCVVDHKPRHLDEHQREVLESLALAATHALEGRRAMLAIQDAALETARSETLLANERRRLNNVVEGAHVGLWDVHIKKGITKVSPRWAEIIGEDLSSLGEITYDHWFDRVHPDDVERMRNAIDEHLAGKTPRFEVGLRVRHRDGRWMSVVDNGRVMTRARDGSVEWLVGSRVDVTAQKQQEDALRMSEQFLDRTGRLAGVGGWLVDLGSDHIYWSAETYRIYGVPFDYVPKLDSALDFFTAESRPIIAAAVEKAIATGKGWDLELPFKRGDGNEIWVRTVGTAERVGDNVTRLVGALQDVTGRVIEHRALKTANARIALATDAGQIGIWELDLLKNDLLWDAWMYRIYGQTPGARRVAPELWGRLITPPSIELLANAVADAVSDKKPFDVEFDIVWDDGTLRHLRSSARLVRDGKGRAVRLTGVTWDVTEARRNAAELAKQGRLSTVHAAVANAANHARTLRDALKTTLDLVCSHMGWPIGHVYERSASEYEVLVPSDVWNASSVECPSFRAETAKTTFQLGVGLIGFALRDRRAAVLTDLTKAPFVRIKSASECKLAWAIAAPVLVGEEIVAVIEFFGRDAFDRAYLDLVSYAGVQIGRVVDRERSNDKLERRSEALREQSRIDELTGLYNRRGFMELADNRRVVAARANQRVFLLFADLDGMKRINDELGHDMGDLAIRELSAVLRRTLRTSDIMARLGGDEFVALTAETGTFDATSLVRRLENDVAQVNAEKRLPFELSASFGFAGPADPNEPLADVLKRADEEMYKVKVARKKNRT